MALIHDFNKAKAAVGVTGVTAVTTSDDRHDSQSLGSEGVTKDTIRDSICVTTGDNSFFEERPDGIWHVTLAIDGHREPRPVKTWICSPLEIRAATRDEEGENWGRLLSVLDMENNAHEWAMPMEMLRGSGDDYRGVLLNLRTQSRSWAESEKLAHDLHPD